MEQLRKIFTHSEQRLKGGEKWEGENWNNGIKTTFEITEMDQVTCIWETDIHDCLRQVNLYVSNKWVILPGTVETKWSLVEVNVIHWSLVCRLDVSRVQVMATSTQPPDYFIGHWFASSSVLCIGCRLLCAVAAA